MKKAIRIINFSIYTLLSFGVSYYAFNYVFQTVDPNNDFQIKMLTSGWIPPTHFIAGGLALALTPFQLSQKFRNLSKNLHRTVGMFYVLCVLIGGITGLIMALNASGGWVAKLGFFNLAVAWLVITTLAFYYAFKGDISKHRRWIYRSVAVTAAAITLRLFLGIGLGVLQLPFFTVYVPASWLCWILNLMLCEWLLYRKKLSSKSNQTKDAFA
ncbi:hypothetical protein MNBD_GAMMA02-1155 [hydrothermal vent metagenome]|uniref:DUF2306 domain-containing protein n=1 Tax=hydrothermal vent metagenome TaxID=652676 RepID=A0A3B0VUN9_9ZZZZ